MNFIWINEIVEILKIERTIAKEKEFMVNGNKQPRLSEMRLSHLYSKIGDLIKEEV